jgi:hypothetical protein
MSTYSPIATQTLASATSSVTFTSIPQGYTDLVVVIGYKAATTNQPTLQLTFNGSSSSYSGTQLTGNGSAAASYRNTGAAFISIARVVGVPSTVGNTGTIIINLQNYSNTTTYKTVLARANAADTGTEADVGLWQNTSAITSFTIAAATSNDFASGTTFSLYGIQVGNAAQKAQGGNIVTSDGTYVYHTFTSSGSFIPSQALTVDYLVVAGGGGAGDMAGGGAGGLRCTVTASGGTPGTVESALSLTAKAYPVIVGAGGAGATTGSTQGISGSNSVFGSITSIGGGGGGGYEFTLGLGNGLNGGSGGGSAGNTTGGTPGTGTANQGFGGTGKANNVFGQGGGGGGASTAAVATANGNGDNGGAGVTTSISGSSITYAGGGGGSGQNTGGAGGTGGGGTGRSASVSGPTSGTTNTGGGGGGSYYVNGLPAGSGGSGIVIIRYAI